MKRIRQFLTLSCVCGAALAAAPARSQTLLPVFQVTVSVSIDPPSTTQSSQYWIGVAVENIGDTVGRWLKLKAGQGLVISKVIPGSPADTAQLHADDLLLEINGKPLTEQKELMTAAGSGAPMHLLILRNGDRMTIDVTPQPKPANLRTTTASLPLAPPGGNMQSNRVALKGGFLDIGPGYKLNTNALPDAVGNEKIWKMVQGGGCVIISQTKDLRGNMHTSITLNEKTYDLAGANAASLPPEIRELALSLGLMPTIQLPPLPPAPREAAPPDPASLEKTMRDQQDQIADLKKQLEFLSQQLHQQSPAPQPPPQH
jgi:hypothetical protein